MNSLKLINVLKEANARVSAVKSFVDKVADGAALAKANKPLFDAFTEVLNFARTDANQIRGVKVGAQNTDNILKTVDELMYALKTPNGMKAETVGLLNQGLLKAKSTPINMVDDIAKDVVAQEKFISRYGQLTDKQMKEALIAAGYSENAANSLIANAKKNPKFKAQMKKGVEKRREAKNKKNTKGADQKMNPKGDGSNVPAQQKKTLSERAKELMDMIKVKKMSWKQVVGWAAAIGISAYALWWYLYDNSDTVPTDTPETEPIDTGEWAPCIQELIKSGEGKVATASSGATYVMVKNEEYPGSIAFYSNGRVYDIAGNKKGNWKCKNAQITIQEQVDDTISTDVETMIDLLDFPVSQQDLIDAGALLKRYVDNGKGKQFMSLYQQSGLGGGTLSKSLNNIVTTQAKSVQAKNYLKTLVSQIESGTATAPTPTTGNKVGLGGIEITWDGAKTDSGETPTPPKSGGGSKFRDCNSEPLPHKFGCRSEKVKQVQTCLNLPEKYRTGNFGPITKKAIEEMGIDLSGGITQDIIDRICGGKKLDRTTIEPIKNTDRLKMSDLAMPKVDMKLPNIKPLEATPSQFYNALRDAGLIFGEDGNRRIKYKGDELDDVLLGKLDTALSEMGYSRIKQKDKDYGVKYVWEKQ